MQRVPLVIVATKRPSKCVFYPTYTRMQWCEHIKKLQDSFEIDQNHPERVGSLSSSEKKAKSPSNYYTRNVW